MKKSRIKSVWWQGKWKKKEDLILFRFELTEIKNQHLYGSKDIKNKFYSSETVANAETFEDQ